MRQPTPMQWAIICAVAALLVLAWPPEQGRSLIVKAANWIVDPGGSLPTFPPPLPMGLDDDGDAVAAHDAQESEYYRVRERSAITRWRMDMKIARDPFEPQTERQLLIALAVLSGLAVWRLSRSDAGTT
jgi:hypothetical protein